MINFHALVHFLSLGLFLFHSLGFIIAKTFLFSRDSYKSFSLLWFINILCSLTDISFFVVSLFRLFSAWKLKICIGSFVWSSPGFVLPFGFGWWVIKLFLAVILSRKEQQLLKNFGGFFGFVFFMSKKIVTSLYCCPTELFLVVYGRAAWKILWKVQILFGVCINLREL